MINANTAAAPAAPKPRDRGEGVDRVDKNRKPYPCVLTQAIIDEQLG